MGILGAVVFLFTFAVNGLLIYVEWRGTIVDAAAREALFYSG
jgi:hypothetical protein